MFHDSVHIVLNRQPGLLTRLSDDPEGRGSDTAARQYHSSGRKAPLLLRADFESRAVAVLSEGLAAGDSPVPACRATRLLQAYELSFWDALAEGL